MLAYTSDPKSILKFHQHEINSFISEGSMENIDWNTVNSFGEEWSKFSSFSEQEIKKIGDDYFDIVNEEMLNKTSLVLDLGCGTGRWSKYISSRSKFVEAIDPSNAVFSAMKLLEQDTNVRVTQASVDHIPFQDNSFD
jgi:ubiquinone/menaquinone biosynthesis C-methylase UbiE